MAFARVRCRPAKARLVFLVSSTLLYLSFICWKTDLLGILLFLLQQVEVRQMLSVRVSGPAVALQGIWVSGQIGHKRRSATTVLAPASRFKLLYIGCLTSARSTALVPSSVWISNNILTMPMGIEVQGSRTDHFG